jgi:hypothetical protein
MYHPHHDEMVQMALGMTGMSAQFPESRALITPTAAIPVLPRTSRPAAAR